MRRILLAAAFLASTSFSAYAQQVCGTVSTCPNASLPFSGNEYFYIVQSGVSKKATIGNILAQMNYGLTGYLYGNGNNAPTASTTIPGSVITGALPNASIPVANITGILGLNQIPLVPYNVENYGCVGSTSTGSADQASCIQSVINTANAGGGGIVEVPAAYWNLKSQVIVDQNVELECVNNGAGTQFNVPSLTYGFKSGSIFAILWGSGSGAHNIAADAAFQLQAGAGIERCGFWYPNQIESNATPTEYGATILVYGPSGTNDNVGQFARDNWCVNCYDFLDFRGSLAGLGIIGADVERNVGSPIAFGVIINYVVDSSIFKNNHFNSGFLNPSDVGGTGLVAWAQNNGIQYLIQHADWIHLIHPQGFGYAYGVFLDMGPTCCGPFVDDGPIVISQAGFDGNIVDVAIGTGTTQSLRIEDGIFTAFNADTDAAGEVVQLESGATLSQFQMMDNFVFGKTNYTAQLVPAGGGALGDVIISGNDSQSSSGTGTCIDTSGGGLVTVTSNICVGFGTAYSLVASSLVNQNNQ